MATLRELRQRRQSIKASQKMTSAMKLVAAAKLRQFQKKWDFTNAQVQNLESTLARVVQTIDPASFPLITRPPRKKNSQTLWIVVGADRGFCGGFNTQLSRFFLEQYKDQPNALVISVGNRVTKALKDAQIPLMRETPMETPLFSYVATVIDSAFALFETQEIERCSIVYTHFINVLKQEIRILPLLPFSLESLSSSTTSSREPVDYEPSPTVLCDGLARLLLKGMAYRTLLESCLSEQGARMTAMDNATRNGRDMLQELDLTYNSKRQSLITNELIEVISGANI